MDNIGLTLGLIIGNLIAFFGAVVLLAWYYEKTRTEAVQALADRLHWSFSPESQPELLERLQYHFHLFSHRRGSISHVMGRSIAQMKVYLFDYTYITGFRAKHQRAWTQTVMLFDAPDWRLPTFALRPETVWHKIGGLLGYQDIDFESHPTFSARYLLQGKNEVQVRRLFNSGVLRFYEEHPPRVYPLLTTPLSTEASGNILIMYRAKQRVSPGKIPKFINTGLDVFNLFHKPEIPIEDRNAWLSEPERKRSILTPAVKTWLLAMILVGAVVLTNLLVLRVFRNPDRDLANVVESYRTNFPKAQKAIEQGANVNCQIPDGHFKGTPALIYAIYQGKTDIVKLLLEHGADMNSIVAEGPFKDSTALRVAIDEGEHAILKLLLEHEADMNVTFTEGPFKEMTPLMFAIMMRQNASVQILLEHGVNVNFKNTEGRTALMEAVLDCAVNCDIALVKRLLDYDADVNLQGSFGSSPLFLAASVGSPDLVALLLEHGADVTMRTTYGETALMRAAQRGYVEIVKLLLAHGSEVHAINNSGETALKITEKQGHTEIIRLLKEEEERKMHD